MRKKFGLLAKCSFWLGTILAVGAGWWWYKSGIERATATSSSLSGDSETTVSEKGTDVLIGILGPLLPPAKYDRRRVLLGKELFLEKKISKDGTISCASCHDLNRGGVDGRQFSVGVLGQIGGANAPTVFNSSFNFKQFWDGRAENFFEQAEGPVQNPKEMGSAWPDVVAKLQADKHYSVEFSRIFPDGVTHQNIVAVIVDFEKTLVTLNSPFDKYLNGDAKALTEEQISGYKKFTSYGCVACHQGRNIGGNMFQTFGIADDYFRHRGGFYESDLGRYNVTKIEADKHVFRVPSLRNVDLTAPYFHDGSAKTLNEAVHIMAKYQLGRNLPERDISDIVSFLKSLTGEPPETIKLERTADEQ